MSENASRKDVRKHVRLAKQAKSVNLRLNLSAVDNAAAVKAATGVDIAGYQRVLDSSAIRKTLRDHGDAKAEGARNPRQSPITPVDFERIPAIVAKAKKIGGGYRASKTKPPTLAYEADVERWTYNYREEIRRGRKQVALKMWKKKK